jgi:ubiquinol-cytochrome c reductase cytochrome c subunit
MTTTTKRPRGARTKLRRRVAGLLALGFALLSAGMLFAAFAPQAQTAQAQQEDA